MKNLIIVLALNLAYTLEASAVGFEAKKPALDEKRPIEDSKIIDLDHLVEKSINGVKGVDLKRGKIIIDLKKVKLQEIRLENGDILDMESYLLRMAESQE